MNHPDRRRNGAESSPVVSALSGGSDSHKALMWDRWRQGESLHQMARLFDLHHSSVRGVLAETGGMQQWSPEQIAGWLKRTYPDDPSCQVSHETIYRTLFIQSRGTSRHGSSDINKLLH